MFKSKIETLSTTVTYFSDSESDTFPKKNIKKNDIPQKKIDLDLEEASSSKNLEQQTIPQKKIDLDSDSSNSSSDSDSSSNSSSDSEEEASSSKDLDQLDLEMDEPSPHSISFINRSNYHSRFDQMAKPPELIAASRVGFFSTSNNSRFCPSENDYYNQENARYGFDRYEF